LFAALLLMVSSTACLAQNANQLGYNPQADPVAGLAQARKDAGAQGRHVLVIAGGDWCRWCFALDRFLTQNPDVKQSLHASFVILKVYVGDETKNEAFFSKLPPANGYPFFWILSADGKRVQPVSTDGLENGRDGYDKEKVTRFIERYRPR
jgi:thiol:disulfide interchange protein